MTINDLTYKAFVLASLNTPRSIKGRHHTHGDISVKCWPFSQFFLWLILYYFAVKRLLKMPPRLMYVAALSCETLVLENKRLTVHYKVVQKDI